MVPLDKFVDTLSGSGLMTADEVQAFLDGLSEEEKPETGDDLAKLLFRRDRLTKFQTQCIYQGKTRGLVLGNYVVLDKLGKGGMGHVYKAQHKTMKRVVALKVLPSQVSRQEGAVERFHREVVAAARLTHPNIVTAYDAAEDDGVHFLVMELVDGVDLARLVRSKGTVSVAQAIDYVTQAAMGLQYAHEQGVVHRDIKPSNLLLDESGTVKILDMGLARFERELHESTAGRSLTRSGQVMGTLDYMAPEQAMDTHSASAKADIYSLGCTLYFLLVGESVFPGHTMATKIIAHREQPIPSLSDQREDVSPQLDQVFQRMLAKRPEERQESMAEVTRELKICRGSGQDLKETTAFSGGPTGGDPTVDRGPRDGDRIVGPTPTPIPTGSESSAGDWLRAELPEAPSVLRRVGNTRKRKPRKQNQRQLIVFGATAAAALLLVLGVMLAFRMPDQEDLTEVAAANAKDQMVAPTEEDRTVTSTMGAEPDGLDRTPATPQAIPNEALEPEKKLAADTMNGGGQTRSIPQPASTVDDNLVGTTWKVTDSAGDHYVFMFQSDGVLHYEAGRGLRKNGTWKKNGNTINIETNNGYATLEGTLSGNEMSGDGSSTNGESWTWRAESE
jgi:serine/threonine protein kinase